MLASNKDRINQIYFFKFWVLQSLHFLGSKSCQNYEVTAAKELNNQQSAALSFLNDEPVLYFINNFFVLLASCVYLCRGSIDISSVLSA